MLKILLAKLKRLFEKKLGNTYCKFKKGKVKRRISPSLLKKIISQQMNQKKTMQLHIMQDLLT